MYNQTNYLIPNTKLAYILHIVIYLYLIKYFILAIKIVTNQGFAFLRGLAFTESSLLINTTEELYIIQTIVLAVFVSTVIIGIVVFVESNKINSFLILGITDILLYSILFAGRKYIYMFIILLFFGIMIFHSKKKSKISFSKLYKSLIIFIIVVFVISYISSFRSISTGYTQFDNIIIYYTGSIKYLDILLENYRNTLYFPNYGNGSISFGFVYNFFEIAKYILTGKEYMGGDYLVSSVTQNYYNISQVIKYNALPTFVYGFLRDFGYIGIIIGGALIGISTSFIEKKYLSNKNSILNKSLYLYLFYVLMQTVFTWEYIYSYTLMIIVFLIIFTIKFKKINR
jgi:oligosaccharide repeat unit polymerase